MMRNRRQLILSLSDRSLVDTTSMNKGITMKGMHFDTDFAKALLARFRVSD
jgi:hypothetical protein